MDLLTPHFGLFFWTLVSFLLVLFILGKFAWKPILNSLKERETKIADSIATAQKVKAEMAQLQSDNEKLLAEAREERSRMLKEAKEAKEKIVSEAKALAKSEADKMISEARIQIENEKNAALTQVKNEIGTLAVEVAEKILRRQLSGDAAQDQYIRTLAEEITLN